METIDKLMKDQAPPEGKSALPGLTALRPASGMIFSIWWL
jgi:hypothetical protein